MTVLLWKDHRVRPVITHGKSDTKSVGISEMSLISFGLMKKDNK